MTVKVMQAGLRGGLSLEGRRYLLLERDVDICDRFEFTHDGGKSPHISRRPDLIQVFFLSFGAYLMGKRRCTLARDPKAELVNDARLGGFPATHLEPYSQAADVVRLPEDIARRSRRGMATGRMWGKHRRRDPSKQKTLFARKRQRAFLLAEQVGFEPTGLERLTDFESASL